jgi:hypothetical protein
MPINVKKVEEKPQLKKKFKLPNPHRNTQQTWIKRNDQITNTDRRHKSPHSVAPKI